VIQSAGLALKIQDQYLNKAGRVDKGVHRQSIWVLWRTSMPSVLTEIGYLTNPQEEKFLGSEKGQTYLAACLFRAFRKYKDEQEGTKKTYNDEIENQVPLEKEKYTIAEVKEEKANEKVEEEAEEEVKKENAENKELKDKEEALAESSAKAKLEAEQKAKAEAAKEKAIADAKAKEEADVKAKEDARIKKANADSLAEVQKAKTKADELEKKYKQLITMADLNFKNKNYTESLDLFQKANAVKGNNDTYATKKIKEIEELNNTASVKTNTVAEVKETDKPKAEINKSGIVFKVQFAATDKEVDTKTKFPNVTDIWFYKVGAVVKYTSGNFNSFDNATKHQTKVKELGYKDCFVAAFKDGARMDINEAKKLAGDK
jgi:N-acetylmuramoyl-L-alanine amidase